MGVVGAEHDGGAGEDPALLLGGVCRTMEYRAEGSPEAKYSPILYLLECDLQI